MRALRRPPGKQRWRGRGAAILAAVLAAPPLGASTSEFPAPDPHVRWINGTGQPTQTCTHDGAPVLLRQDRGQLSCAREFWLLADAPPAAVRQALDGVLARQGFRFEEVPDFPVIAFRNGAWQGVLLSRRPDLRTQLANQALGARLAQARAQGDFTPAQLARVEADALGRTTAVIQELRALPEFVQGPPAFFAHRGHGNPDRNPGEGAREHIAIFDAAALFGSGTTLVYLSRREARMAYRESSGFLQLPFPFNRQRFQSAHDAVPIALSTTVQQALAAVAGARGTRATDRAADWRLPTAPARQSPVLAAWPTARAAAPEAEFWRFDRNAGFAYPKALMSLPDGRLLLAGGTWGEEPHGQAHLMQLLARPDGTIQYQSLWQGASWGFTPALDTHQKALWWTLGDKEQRHLLRWSLEDGSIESREIPATLNREPTVIHPERGPLWANWVAFHGFRSLANVAEESSVLLAPAARAPAGPPGDGIRDQHDPPGMQSVLPLPNGERLRLLTLAGVYPPSPRAEALPVRDARRLWWVDEFIFATAHSDGRLAGGAGRRSNRACAYQGPCLGSVEGNWLAHARRMTLPRLPQGGPDRAAVAELLAADPHWDPGHDTVDQPPLGGWASAVLGRRVDIDSFLVLELSPLEGDGLPRAWALPGSDLSALARSANGHWLASLSKRDGRTHVHLIDTRQHEAPIPLALPEGMYVELLAFSADGRSLWAASRRGLLHWPLPESWRDPARRGSAPDQIRR